MKTFLLTSAAALLVTGTAMADEVTVVQEPFSNVRVIEVGTIPWSTVATDDDGDGMLSADAVTGMDFGIPGFNPDAVIYIWEDQGGVRVTRSLGVTR